MTSKYESEADVEEVFCEESGSKKTGVLRLSAYRMDATFYSFDGRFTIDATQPIVLKTYLVEVATLHDAFLSSDLRWNNRASGGAVCVQPVVANLTVIGNNAWGAGDLLLRGSFYVNGADDLLRHSDTFDRVADAEFTDFVNRDIFEVETSEFVVRTSYAISGSMDFKRPQGVDVAFELEYADGRTIEQFRSDFIYVTRFLSACLQTPFKASDISLSRYTTAEYARRAEAKETIDRHQLLYLHPKYKTDLQVWVGKSFAIMRSDEDRETFKACLKAWLERRAQWDGAAAMMIESFTLSGELSPNRLLAACKWLEEIPGAEPVRAITDEHAAIITAAAVSEAQKHGYTDLDERIEGALKYVTLENNRTRFTRLLQSARDAYRHEMVPDAIIADLMKSRDLRGRAAHGKVDVKTEQEYDDYQRVTVAVEALAYLLTVKDLPLDADGPQRVRQSEYIQRYLRANELAKKAKA